MFISIEISDSKFKEAIEEAVRQALEEGGLLSYIRTEVKRVSREEYKKYPFYILEKRVCKLEKTNGGNENGRI